MEFSSGKFSGKRAFYLRKFRKSGKFGGIFPGF
jgi:hypothetical protein